MGMTTDGCPTHPHPPPPTNKVVDDARPLRRKITCMRSHTKERGRGGGYSSSNEQKCTWPRERERERERER